MCDPPLRWKLHQFQEILYSGNEWITDLAEILMVFHVRDPVLAASLILKLYHYSMRRPSNDKEANFLLLKKF